MKYLKMRSLLFFVVLMGIQLSLKAQCDAYFPFIENTSLTYTYFDKKGKFQSKSQQTIESVEQMSDGSLKAAISAKNMDKKGEEISEVSFDVFCKDDALEMDFSSIITPELQASMTNMEVSISGDNFRLPSDLKVGQEIPDISSDITADMNGFTVIRIHIEQLNKKVEAKESITTDAGTFDCFRVSYDTNLKMIVRTKQHVVTWYNKKVGLVKQEIYNKKDKLESSQVLSAYAF